MTRLSDWTLPALLVATLASCAQSKARPLAADSADYDSTAVEGARLAPAPAAELAVHCLSADSVSPLDGNDIHVTRCTYGAWRSTQAHGTTPRGSTFNEYYLEQLADTGWVRQPVAVFFDQLPLRVIRQLAGAIDSLTAKNIREQPDCDVASYDPPSLVDGQVDIVFDSAALLIYPRLPLGSGSEPCQPERAHAAWTDVGRFLVGTVQSGR